MRDQPAGLDESGLRRVLPSWGIDAVSLTYAPVGFGDYHWTTADGRDRQWFVTVADLAHKGHCGSGTEAAFRGLCHAMDTASSLRDRSGLDFVVAPLRTARGETVLRLDDRYALSVFPFVEGDPGHFGQALTPQERGAVLDLLAALHRSATPASAPARGAELSTRAELEAALAELGRPWYGGPYAEPARALMADSLRDFRRRLDEFDQRARDVSGNSREPVVTHGEPHPGNVLQVGERRLLVDWDTVGLAVPERDLWLVATEPDDLARYEDAGGHRPDPSALALYRLRWALEDVAAYLEVFRSPHARTPDAVQAWTALAGTMEELTGNGPPEGAVG